MRTSDVVVIDASRRALEDAGLLVIVLDGHISALEGGIGAFPRRLLVIDTEADEARRTLSEAGLAEWLISP